MIRYHTLKQTDNTGLWNGPDKALEDLANNEKWHVICISHISENHRFVFLYTVTAEDKAEVPIEISGIFNATS